MDAHPVGYRERQRPDRGRTRRRDDTGSWRIVDRPTSGAPRVWRSSVDRGQPGTRPGAGWPGDPTTTGSLQRVTTGPTTGSPPRVTTDPATTGPLPRTTDGTTTGSLPKIIDPTGILARVTADPATTGSLPRLTTRAPGGADAVGSPPDHGEPFGDVAGTGGPADADPPGAARRAQGDDLGYGDRRIGWPGTDEIPRYRTGEIPRYRTGELPRYRTGEIPRYRTGEIPRYRTGEIPRYREQPTGRHASEAPAAPSRGPRPRVTRVRRSRLLEPAVPWPPVLAWTIALFAVPMLAYLAWAWTRSGTPDPNCITVADGACVAPRTAALTTFTDAFPGVVAAIALSVLASAGLRLLNYAWRAVTIALGGAVIGAGLTTVVVSALG